MASPRTQADTFVALLNASFMFIDFLSGVAFGRGSDAA
jgi:hypothetical protein